MTTPDAPLGPLRFERRALAKPWGGRRLEKVLGIALPPGAPIGETWELSDRDEEPSIVAEGPLRGTRLRTLLERRGAEILGDTAPAANGRFPLLVKFLDASEPLSLQVHPRVSRPATGDEAKTEAWYFLATEPGARVWLGASAGTDRARLERSVGKRELLDCVRELPARAGECVLVRGGTVHAIGAGIALFEVQENSDTTHRLYDWDRVGLDGKPRAMHVEAGLRSIDLDVEVETPRAPRFVDGPSGVRRARLVDCELFGLERIEATSALELDGRRLATLLVGLAGRARIEHAHGAIEITPGDVWLVPASLGEHRVVPIGGAWHGLRVDTRPRRGHE